VPARLAVFAPQKFAGRYRGEYADANGQPIEVWLDVYAMESGPAPAFRYNLRVKVLGGAMITRQFDQPGQVDPATKRVQLATEGLRDFALEVKDHGHFRLSSLEAEGLVLE
jgi:hypothetical protein